MKYADETTPITVSDAPAASSRNVVSEDRKPFPILTINSPRSGASTIAITCADIITSK
jgi:hypothetical protein